MTSHYKPNNANNEIDKVIGAVCNPKYLEGNELHSDAMARIAGTLKDGDEHFKLILPILREQRFLPAGRIQASVGAARQTTAFNCYVSDTIEDSRIGIFKRLQEAAETMGLGGGDGFDFSPIRPRGALIKSQGSGASGPVSYMRVWDTMCATIASAGNRRGAMMGVLRVDHPDIEEFIDAKRTPGELTNFNISVAITDKFMEAVRKDTTFDLVFNSHVYNTIRARYLWDKIMRSTWSHAEPGVLFIDTINKKNNLYYCETIAATNPCLHPDSLVETVDGRVRISDIKEPTMVYTMLPDGSLGIRKSSASWVSKKDAKLVKITTRNGKSVRVTPNHKIAVRRNNGIEWVEASRLELGSCLVQLCRARRGVAYSGVKLTTEDNRAYQMEHRMVAEAVYGVEDYHDVHHIDGDTYNNCRDNLQVLNHGEHSRHTALFDNPQSHQIKCVNGMFVSTGITPKTIIPMPEELRSNMKNNYSCVVTSVEECVETTDVYDLTVEETHNFIADFTVVHNCGEQPLPPNGACLLGSFNLVKYIVEADDFDQNHRRYFNYEKLENDIPPIIRMMDNVIDNTVYPLKDQEVEAKSKRRMGIGITGLANTAEILGLPYGSEGMIKFMRDVLECLRDCAYKISIELAKEKGVFPAFDKEKYIAGQFVSTLPEEIRKGIETHGLRNSHLLSIAPTGTISLFAGNISSGIEPPFSLTYQRRTIMPDGSIFWWNVMDYAYDQYGVRGKTSEELTADEHINVLCVASSLVDSACSKTCNVGNDVSFEDFKQLYMNAYTGGASGCTTFRPASIEVRGEVMKAMPETGSGSACFIDPVTGDRSCSD